MLRPIPDLHQKPRLPLPHNYLVNHLGPVWNLPHNPAVNQRNRPVQSQHIPASPETIEIAISPQIPKENVPYFTICR